MSDYKNRRLFNQHWLSNRVSLTAPLEQPLTAQKSGYCAYAQDYMDWIKENTERVGRYSTLREIHEAMLLLWLEYRKRFKYVDRSHKFTVGDAANHLCIHYVMMREADRLDSVLLDADRRNQLPLYEVRVKEVEKVVERPVRDMMIQLGPNKFGQGDR